MDLQVDDTSSLVPKKTQFPPKEMNRPPKRWSFHPKKEPPPKDAIFPKRWTVSQKDMQLLPKRCGKVTQGRQMISIELKLFQMYLFCISLAWEKKAFVAFYFSGF